MFSDSWEPRRVGLNGHGANGEGVHPPALGRPNASHHANELSPSTLLANNSSELTEFLKSKLAVLKRWRRLVLGSVVTCLVLAVVYLVVARRLYESEAQVLVLEHGNRPLSVAKEGAQEQSGMEDYLPTQMAILESPRVVQHAIALAGVENLPSLKKAVAKGANSLGGTVKKFLTVSRPDRNAMIVKLAYRAWSPAEANLMMNSLLKSYDSFLEEHYQQNNSKIVTILSKARDELNGELRDLEKKHLLLLQGNPVLGMVSEDASRSMFARRLEKWDDASNDLRLKAARLRSQLNVAKKLENDGAGMISVAFALNQLGGESAGGLFSGAAGMAQGVTGDYVRQLANQQQELADQHGPEYAKVREIQSQISRVVEQARDSRRRIEKSEITDVVSSIEESLLAIETTRTEVVEQFDREMVQAKTFATDHAEEANLRDNVHRQRELFHTVVEQLKQAQLGGDFSGISAHVTESANASESPVNPRLERTLLIALLAGCMLGAVVALAADVLDSRVHSHFDLLQVADYPVIGRVPQIGPELTGTSGNASLLTHLQPRSPEAEAYRATRTCIDYLRRYRDAQVILVTSPVAGDGKSITASNLAISLAQAGRRVLLIDADHRRPTVHRSHGLRCDLGLTSVLKEIVAPADAIQRSAVENLEIMTCGPMVLNPAELLMSPRFKELIDEMRGQFDLVVVDSSPLNLVTDPSIIGSVADGILLVVRQSRTQRHDIEHTVELLRTLGTPVLGMLINGVSRPAIGYSYAAEDPGEDAVKSGGEKRNGHPIASGVPNN
jgi:succinoglycan biosynthesis transport protein ExoP